LTEIEKGIISTYIASGYKVKEKRVINETTKESAEKKRITKTVILEYLENDEKRTKELESKKDELIIDKNGKERKGGWLVAIKWFKKEYPEDVKKILELKEKLEETK